MSHETGQRHEPGSTPRVLMNSDLKHFDWVNQPNGFDRRRTAVAWCSVFLEDRKLVRNVKFNVP